MPNNGEAFFLDFILFKSEREVFTRPNVAIMFFLTPIPVAFTQRDCADAVLNSQSEDAEKQPLDYPLPPGAITRLGKSDFQENRPGTLSANFLTDHRTVIVAGPENKVIFWRSRTGQRIRAIAGQMYMAISPDGKTMASRRDRKDEVIRFFDLETEKLIGETRGWKQGVRFCFSPDGRYLVIEPGENARAEDLPLRLVDLVRRP